jgi:hypothetical protein
VEQSHSKYEMRYHELLEYRLEVEGGNALNLQKNPMPSLLLFFVGSTRRGVARGCIIGPDVYFWDACLATHEDIQTHFGVPVEQDGFDVAEIEDMTKYLFACQEHQLDRVLEHPMVQQAINDPRISIAREDGSYERLLDRLGRRAP